MPYWFDGNNLIGQSSARSRSRPHLREEFLSTLRAYYKAGGSRVLVYLDGDDTTKTMPPAGIRVRYSAPLSADEAIVRRLREISRPGEVIVVTNDQELQSRCRNAGAKVMNWRHFSSRMQIRKMRRPSGKDSQQPVDVEDWMEYFGLDKSKI
jgi:predicted RNA-binding protein with PIN domain